MSLPISFTSIRLGADFSTGVGRPERQQPLERRLAKARRELRQKSGHSPRNDYVTPKDPHSSIPHASSGKTRHSGRGGFPGIDGLFILFNRLFPSTLSRVSSMIRRYEEDGLIRHTQFESWERCRDAIGVPEQSWSELSPSMLRKRANRTGKESWW